MRRKLNRTDTNKIISSVAATIISQDATYEQFTRRIHKVMKDYDFDTCNINLEFLDERRESRNVTISISVCGTFPVTLKNKTETPK